MQEPENVFVKDFEFDERNIRHLAKHGVTPEFVWLIWFDQPVFVWNRPPHSASHLMIGMDPLGVLWTIALTLVEYESGTWRPITCFPTEREDERNAWHGEN